jgi:hypothetical protein
MMNRLTTSLILSFLTVLLLAPLASLHAAETTNVQLDGGRCLKVNGKPFFAIGMYSAAAKDFPMLAEAGFNTVHAYGWEHLANAKVPAWGREYLDAAQQHGLKALVGLNRSEIVEKRFENSGRRIEMFRDHPALLAWHTMDEPGAGTKDSKEFNADLYMPAIYQTIKQHDPHHPITAVLCRFAHHNRFSASLDIHQADYYPIPPIPAGNFSGTGFAGIAGHAQHARKASDGQKPFWFVCQAFDYALLRKDKDTPPEWQRFPTQTELRTMSYTAVAAGARGILYWSLSAMRKYVREGGTSAEEHWRRVSSVARELRDLSPVLTAETPETFSQKNNVVALIKSDGRDLYIIAANYERKPTKTVLQMPGIENATAQMVFGERTAPVVEGRLTLNLDSIESCVYRISK